MDLRRRPRWWWRRHLHRRRRRRLADAAAKASNKEYSVATLLAIGEEYMSKAAFQDRELSQLAYHRAVATACNEAKLDGHSNWTDAMLKGVSSRQLTIAERSIQQRPLTGSVGGSDARQLVSSPSSSTEDKNCNVWIELALLKRTYVKEQRKKGAGGSSKATSVTNSRPSSTNNEKVIAGGGGLSPQCDARARRRGHGRGGCYEGRCNGDATSSNRP